MKRIYIAAPLTGEEPGAAMGHACRAATRVMEWGGLPFVPHLASVWNAVTPLPRDVWLAWCLEWVGACDALLRLPGRSEGADLEAAHAVHCGVRVFLREEELRQWLGR